MASRPGPRSDRHAAPARLEARPPATRALATLCASDAPLTLVAAPGGYGKSWLLRALADDAAAQGRVAVFRTLEACATPGGLAERADLVLIDDVRAEDGERLERLVRAIASTGGSPRRPRHVVATRTLPDLDWLSLEIGGLVRLLRTEDLALDRGETARLLGDLGVAADRASASVAALAEWSGGWPLAIRHAAMVARRRGRLGADVLAEAARSGDIGRYLAASVMAGMDDAMRTFLLSLIDLDGFDGEMVAALMGSPAAALLARAQAQNLMIVPAAGPGARLAFHPLFRAHLREHRLRSGIAVDRGLLRRAAAFAIAAGRHADGIDCLLRADAADEAERHILASANALFEDAGELPRLRRWADEIERRTGTLAAPIRLWRAWALALALDIDAARAELARATAALDENAAPEHLAHRDRLHISIAAQDGRFDEVIARAGRWQADWGESRAFHAAAVSALLALSLHAVGRPTAARTALADARRLARGTGRAYAHLWVTTIESLLELEAGRATRAALLLQRDLDRPGDDAPVARSMAALMSTVAARLAIETGDTAAAERWLGAVEQAPAVSGIAETRFAAIDARALLSAADLDRALAALADAGAPGRRLALLTAERAVTLLLSHGRVAEARARFDAEIGEAAAGAGPSLADAALTLAEGRTDLAAARAAALVTRCESEGRGRLLVGALLVAAGAAAQAGQAGPARRALHRALRLAAEGGLRRTLLDHGRAVAELLRRADCDEGLGTGEAGLVRMMRAALGIDADRTDGQPIEPLTARETEVLHLLDSGLTSERLAARMAMGQSTAKWHIKNIYAKLGVHNRSGALARARQHALI